VFFECAGNREKRQEDTVATFLHALIVALVLCFAQSEVQATTITIDPLRTFLFTNNDPWSGIGSVAGSVPIRLSDVGISGGDTIHLEMLGDWYDGHAGYSGNVASLDVVSEMIGVFSNGTTLLAPNMLNRVSGSLDAGIHITTWNTLFGNLSTDIPHDFGITSTLVQVPFDATHLFVAAHDIYYSDNSDPDGDFGVRINKVASVPEPSTFLLFVPGVIALALFSRIKFVKSEGGRQLGARSDP
jgi:hypothetical protein